ncbi:MAG: amidohydrolase family protein [Deltaproteobacteria bacterium]|nr:amidohydrolase family protein [Deltaproteobacteria bacterium]
MAFNPVQGHIQALSGEITINAENAMREKTTIIRTKNILGLAVLASILAWATYGTTAGVLGMIAYLAVGLLGVFPWIIPFAGIPLGLLDLVGIPGLGMYEATLKIAHLDTSWLTALWYLIVVAVAGIAGLIFSIMLWNALFRKPARPRNLALINCHIIDGRRDSRMIDDGVILVRNISEKGETAGCIIAAGPAAEIAVPEGYEKIDLGGQYVLPGFINAHCHLISSGKPTFLARIISENEYITDKLAALLTTRPGKFLFLKMMEKNTRNALHAGVTTIRTLGDLAWLDVKLRNMIDTNKILGPRMLVSGPIICPTGGHGSYMALTADSAGEFARAVRTNLHKQVDWIKIASTGGVMDARSIGEAGRPQMTVEEIETVCTHAHQGGFMVATHCESTSGIEDALAGGVDTIEHGADIPENMVSLFKKQPESAQGVYGSGTYHLGAHGTCHPAYGSNQNL